MKYKAVIFDLDGTLLDTLDDLADGVNYALKEHSMPLRSREEIRRFVGNGVANLISRAVPSGTEAEVSAHVLSIFKAYYAEHSRVKTKPYDGILELLDTLSENGVKTAIVSNKFDAAVKELNSFYFGKRIPVAIGERPDMLRKPAPDTVLLALKELDCSAEDAVYIGDSGGDITTARNAKTDSIAVTWGFRSESDLISNGAQKLAHTTAELLSLLLDSKAS